MKNYRGLKTEKSSMGMIFEESVLLSELSCRKIVVTSEFSQFPKEFLTVEFVENTEFIGNAKWFWLPPIVWGNLTCTYAKLILYFSINQIKFS